MNRIKSLRKKAGLTQKELGKLITVSQQAIHQYENSESEPDISTLKKMSEIFQVSIDTIVKNDYIFEFQENIANPPANNKINIETYNLIYKYENLPKDIKSNLYSLIDQIFKVQNLNL